MRETSPMRKPPTGEPYAGKPHVRFGGRGGESLPDPYSSARKQRTSWPSFIFRSCGSEVRQDSSTALQRSAKRHPEGGDNRLGGSPSMVASLPSRGRSRRGTERSSPIV